MDVKHLERVDDDGLEQWLPVLKAEFPLPARTVESVLASLRLPAPVARAGTSTRLDQLLDEVVAPQPPCARSRSTSGGRATRSAAA